MNHFSNTKYFQIIFFFFCAVSHIYAQYPCQNCIVGNIGEERHNLQGEPVRNRYHYGIDFSQTNNTVVTAIETGPLRKSSGNKFAIGTYGYVHVIPNDKITKGRNDDIIQTTTGSDKSTNIPGLCMQYMTGKSHYPDGCQIAFLPLNDLNLTQIKCNIV